MPSTCTRQKTKKYTSRKSPPYPANQCPVGQKRRGNDGLTYVTVPDKNRVNRWVSVTALARRGKKLAGKKASTGGRKKKKTAAMKASTGGRKKKKPAAKKPSTGGRKKKRATYSCDDCQRTFVSSKYTDAELAEQHRKRHSRKQKAKSASSKAGYRPYSEAEAKRAYARLLRANQLGKKPHPTTVGRLVAYANRTRR